LIEKFYAKALADDGINSATFATLVVKAWERKANLLGLDAVRQVDLQLIRPPDAPTQHERIRQAILSMVEREQPERRAAIRRLCVRSNCSVPLRVTATAPSRGRRMPR